MKEKPNKPARKSKATQAEVRLRVLEILRIMLDGAEWFDVCEFVREQEQTAGSVWELKERKPLSESQVWRYIQKANREIALSCRTSSKRLLRRHLAQRRNLYAKAVNAGDIRTALAVLRDEAELEGLYPPKKIAPTTPDGEDPYDANFSDADRATALQALYARLGTGSGGPASDGQAGAR
jgi:hypothetical protein